MWRTRAPRQGITMIWFAIVIIAAVGARGEAETLRVPGEERPCQGLENHDNLESYSLQSRHEPHRIEQNAENARTISTSDILRAALPTPHVPGSTSMGRLLSSAFRRFFPHPESLRSRHKRSSFRDFVQLAQVAVNVRRPSTLDLEDPPQSNFEPLETANPQQHSRWPAFQTKSRLGDEQQQKINEKVVENETVSTSPLSQEPELTQPSYSQKTSRTPLSRSVWYHTQQQLWEDVAITRNGHEVEQNVSPPLSTNIPFSWNDSPENVDGAYLPAQMQWDATTMVNNSAASALFQVALVAPAVACALIFL